MNFITAEGYKKSYKNIIGNINTKFKAVAHDTRDTENRPRNLDATFQVICLPPMESQAWLCDVKNSASVFLIIQDESEF